MTVGRVDSRIYARVYVSCFACSLMLPTEEDKWFDVCCSNAVCEQECGCKRQADGIASHGLPFVNQNPRRLFAFERERTNQHMVSLALVRASVHAACVSMQMLRFRRR